jgi:two-component system, cell cycle sensor histidine kinase and response regulator CckA
MPFPLHLAAGRRRPAPAAAFGPSLVVACLAPAFVVAVARVGALREPPAIGAIALVLLVAAALAAHSVGRALERERRSRAVADAGERRFQKIFDASQIGLLVIDPATRTIELVNPAFCRISGHAEDELVGRNPTELMEGGVSPVIETGLMPKLLSGEVPHGRTTAVMVRPGGERVFVDIVATIVDGADGRPRLVGTVEDRTESVHAQRDLAESEARYRTLVEGVFEGIVLTVDDAIVELNSGFEHISGYRREELLGRRLCDVIPAATAWPLPERPGAPADPLEIRGRRKDGSEFIAAVVSQPVEYRGGRAQLLAINDVTARHDAERERTEARRRYAVLFNSAAVGMTLSRLDGTLIDVNEALASMLGYKRAELVGRPYTVLGTPAAEAGLRSQRALLLSGSREAFALELQLAHRDGSEVPARVTVSLVRDENGEPLYTASVIESIAERRRLEEHVRQTQKMNAIGQLAGGVAHDFNNLLTVIGGHAALLAVPGLAAEARQHAAEIGQATERATALTQQLLAFSRKQVLRPRDIDLNAVVESMERMLRRLIGDEFEIETRLADDLPLVHADPTQLEQVLLNLVVNARDAMPRGGTISIATGRSALEQPHGGNAGPHAFLSVTDTGVGIDDETREHIFEPFFTTKERGRGTGLGLATVFGVVDQTGGRIEVDSVPGAGSTFTVHLPAATAPAALEPVPPPAERRPPHTGRVLLVEDDPAVRRLAATILSRDGHDVLVAANGDDALRQLERDLPRPIDALVTDLAMPGMPGTEVARRVRSRNPDVGVVYMSGNPNEDAGDDGEGELLAKPFSPALLSARVAQAVAASQRRRAA